MGLALNLQNGALRLTYIAYSNLYMKLQLVYELIFQGRAFASEVENILSLASIYQYQLQPHIFQYHYHLEQMEQLTKSNLLVENSFDPIFQKL